VLPRRKRSLTALAVATVLSTLALASPASAAVVFVSKWGSVGSADGQFTQPRGIATDSAGSVYVADTQNSRIEKFAPDGTFLAKWGTTGSGDGQFAQASPYGIAIDGADNVYAADRNNNRIEKFSSSGAFLSKFGTFGTTGLGQLAAPQGVAVDSAGNIFVSEYSNHRIHKFNSAGSPLATFGGRGAGNGQFEFPNDVAVDPSGNVYVADTGNNRVQKLTSTGAFVTAWGGVGSADGQFRSPLGVTVDSGGSVYVADSQNYRIARFSSSGTFLDGFGSRGTGDGQFNIPPKVALRGSDIYVTDTFNHRVHRFRTDPAAAGLPAPALGRSLNAEVVRGQVFVSLPGNAAFASVTVPGLKGRRFVPLTTARQIPMGSLVDTRRGTVRIKTAQNASASLLQSGEFTSGVFQVLQSRRASAKGLTELGLKGSSFATCGGSARGQRTAFAALSRRVVRRLRSRVTGRFRTRGRYSAATVRGTTWLTTDRCDGTLTRVSRGRVVVRDFRRRKNITLRAGKSYLARAPA
jgi:sugar lactone lactonase YvrE